MTSDNTQINSDPNRVMAQRGILSRNPTFSITVTISVGIVISEIVDSPEDVIMVDTMPCKKYSCNVASFLY